MIQPPERPCMDREHDPPMHLYIPPGQSYTHICPSCKKKTVLYSGSPIY